RFYDCDSCVVHKQIQRLLFNLTNEIGNTVGYSKIVNQTNYTRTLMLDGIARLCECDCIASMQKQLNFRPCEFLSNRASSSAARPGDQISFHLVYLKTSNTQPELARRRPHMRCRIEHW